MMASLPAPCLCGLQCAAVPSVHKDIGCGGGRDSGAQLQTEGGLPRTGNFQIPLHRPGSRAPPSQSLMVPLLAPRLVPAGAHPPLVLGPPSDRRLCAQGLGYIPVEAEQQQGPQGRVCSRHGRIVVLRGRSSEGQTQVSWWALGPGSSGSCDWSSGSKCTSRT